MGAIETIRGVWVRKLKRNLQDHGLKTLLQKSLAFAIKPFYEDRTYRLYMIDFTRSTTPAAEEIEGINFHFLLSSEDQLIAKVESMSEWLHGSLKNRLEHGALCLVAVSGGSLAGFNLISFGEIYMPLIKLHRNFRKDEAWSEQISVDLNLRKKGLAANLRFRIFEELRRRGYRKLYGGALVDNIPSLKLAQRVGFRLFVDVRYSRVFASEKRQFTRLK